MAAILALLMGLVFVAKSEAYNFLILLPVCAQSHKNVFLPIAEELGRRGHYVTFFSTQPPRGPPMENVREVFGSEIEDLLHSETPNLFEVTSPVCSENRPIVYEFGIIKRPSKFLQNYKTYKKFFENLIALLFNQDRPLFGVIWYSSIYKLF